MTDKVQVSAVEMLSLLSEGYTLSDLAGLQPEQMENLYALAYQYYNADNYEDARNIFRALCLYDPSEEKYFMGLAASEQGLGNYQQASDLYATAAVLSGLKDPQPMYYAAVCLLKAGKKDEAILALRSLELMGREGKHAKQDESFLRKGRTLLQALSPADATATASANKGNNKAK